MVFVFTASLLLNYFVMFLPFFPFSFISINIIVVIIHFLFVFLCVFFCCCLVRLIVWWCEYIEEMHDGRGKHRESQLWVNCFQCPSSNRSLTFFSYFIHIKINKYKYLYQRWYCYCDVKYLKSLAGLGIFQSGCENRICGWRREKKHLKKIFTNIKINSWMIVDRTQIMHILCNVSNGGPICSER